MPLVFVHGVNVRRDDAYRQSEPVRDGYFRGTALRGVAPDPGRVTIENPYWGDVAARFSWNLAFLPTGTDETFGPGEEAVAEVLAEAAGDVEAAPDQFLLALARQSLPRAVDCLWAVAAFAPADPSGGAALAAVGRKALAYASANPNPPWLGKVTNDDQFAERLLAAVDSWTPSEGPAATEAEAATATATESFGISETWDRIKTAVAAVPGAVADLGRKARDRAEAGAAAAGTALSGAGTAAAGALINPLAAAAPRTFYGRFGLFLGDVFTYLNERGKAGAEGPIVKVVADALRRADAARVPGVDEKLIIVAHSMGGNIVYDILTHYMPDLVCDLFLTVGSQVGLLEELKLFHASDRAIPTKERPKVPARPNLRRWLNVYDPADVFAYRVEPIFAGPKDFCFSTGTTALSAHTSYFLRPAFHERLNAHLVAGGW